MRVLVVPDSFKGLLTAGAAGVPVVVPIVRGPGSLEAALRDGYVNLRDAAERVGRLIGIGGR